MCRFRFIVLCSWLFFNDTATPEIYTYCPPRSLHDALPIVRADIEARIRSGAWPPGHRIPFEHELTATYGCSRATGSKALGALARAGIIDRRRRAGRAEERPLVKARACTCRSRWAP